MRKAMIYACIQPWYVYWAKLFQFNVESCPEKDLNPRPTAPKWRRPEVT